MGSLDRLWWWRDLSWLDRLSLCRMSLDRLDRMWWRRDLSLDWLGRLWYLDRLWWRGDLSWLRILRRNFGKRRRSFLRGRLWSLLGRLGSLDRLDRMWWRRDLSWLDRLWWQSVLWRNVTEWRRSCFFFMNLCKEQLGNSSRSLYFQFWFSFLRHWNVSKRNGV